jgi:hypothetical protein
VHEAIQAMRSTATSLPGDWHGAAARQPVNTGPDQGYDSDLG